MNVLQGNRNEIKENKTEKQENKIITWNCRTLRNNGKTNISKINLIKTINPVVAIINESNAKLNRISKYQII